MAGFFDILSIRNPAIKELVRLRLGRRRARLQKGLALVRGRQLIQFVGESFKFREVYTYEPREAFASYHADRVVRVEKKVLKHVLFGPSKEEQAASLDEDDFVLGTIEQPVAVSQFDKPKRLLALDGIKHPENMSLLLTSAVALKFDGVIVSPSCVDPFSYKVLETTQAAAWTLPFQYATAAELTDLCRRHQLLLCAASADGQPLSDLPSHSEQRGFCLVVGNEATGVSPEILRSCSQVALPMSELIDSLNAGVACTSAVHEPWLFHKLQRRVDRTMRDRKSVV